MTNYNETSYHVELDVSPGEILFSEFLEPLGLTKYRLAKETQLSPTHIGQIIAGKRSITHLAGLRLDRYFGMSDGYFARIQYTYDLQKAQRQLAQIA